ncbi:MAG: Gfo/Idh/MocA family oxidoreductase, partial [Chloroflexus sp.]|uniref:Gfo/Idh/MocA family oxidoreductase n=1 Tax=Chloroflexus sp. TaxID=1904827 RepID=UPI00404A0333
MICDINHQALNEAQKQYPDVMISDDPRQVFKTRELNAVFIATPAATHYELALQALKSGKDTFVEKPLALKVVEGEELVREAQSRGLILMVGHVLEYHPAIRKLKELIDKGELGKVRYIYSNRLNFGIIRTEENVLWSFAPHDIAVMIRLLGAMPGEVACVGGAYLNHEVSDVTLTSLTFPGGIKAHIFVNWLHPFKEQRFVVTGDHKMAVFDDTQPWSSKLVLYPHQVDWIGGTVPVAHKAEGITVPLEEAEPLRLECEHFLKCVEKREQPLTDGESALRVLKILEDAEKSLKEGGRPVRSERRSQQALLYVHPTAVIDANVEIGEGTKIWHFCHISEGARIGQNCTLGQNVFVGRNAVIGNNCKIQNNVSVYEGVTLEDDVFCGPSMVFTNVDRPRSAYPRGPQGYLKTLVKRGCTIGANATILCGTTLGEYSFIGAGAVVTKDIPPYALVYGNPARIQGWMCECGTRLVFKERLTRCSACGRAYEQLSEDAIRKVEGRLEK